MVILEIMAWAAIALCSILALVIALGGEQYRGRSGRRLSDYHFPLIGIAIGISILLFVMGVD